VPGSARDGAAVATARMRVSEEVGLHILCISAKEAPVDVRLQVLKYSRTIAMKHLLPLLL
jgi:hypothetical protein